MNRIEKIGMIQLFGAFFLAGTSVVINKVIISKVPIFITAFISILLAILFLLPFQLKRLDEIKSLKRSNYFSVFIQALTGIVLTRLFTLYGLKYTTSIEAGLVNSSTPAIMVLLSVIILKESPSREKILGIFLGVIGLVVLNGFNFDGGGSSTLFGNILIFGAVISEVLMSVSRKKSKYQVSSITNSFLLFVISGVLIFPFAVNQAINFDISNVDLVSGACLVFYGIFGSGVAYILWGAGVTKVSGTIVGISFTMIPLTVIFLSIIFLGEELLLKHVVGFIFCISGIFMCNFFAKQAENK